MQLQKLVLIMSVGSIVACKSTAGRNTASESKSAATAEGAHTYQKGDRTVADDINGYLESANFLRGSSGAGRNSLNPSTAVSYANMDCPWVKTGDKGGIQCDVDNIAAELTFTIADVSQPSPAIVDVNLELVAGFFVPAKGLDKSPPMFSGLKAFTLENFRDFATTSSEGGRQTYQFRAEVPYKQIPAGGKATVKAAVTFGNFAISKPGLTVRPGLSIKRNFSATSSPVPPAALITYVRTLYINLPTEQ